MEDWVFYKEINFSDESYNKFNIDTRDFCCIGTNDDPLDFSALNKKPERFVYTQDELIALLDRLFIESGGKGSWRFLQLEGRDTITRNWNLKYLRIFRHGDGFVVCNNNNYAINKDVLNNKVEKEYLNFIKD
jgi:hypothetical protein